MSQLFIAEYPEENPTRPVMPTSNGLSYSMYSLPRSECTIGACNLRASSTTSVCESLQPAPQSKVTRDDWFNRRASFAMSALAGRIIGADGALQLGTGFVSGPSATLPGITTTATPLRATAVRIARPRI